MEIDNNGTAVAAAATGAAPNDGNQSDETKGDVGDLIMAPGIVSWMDNQYQAQTERSVGPAADLGLGYGEYYIPDEILDKIEATGHDNPDCEMEEGAEEVEPPIYEEALLSLGMKRVLEGEEGAMERRVASQTTLPPDAAGRPTIAGTSSEAAASLNRLPEILLQLILRFRIREAHEAILLERVCKPLHWALRSDGGFWDQHPLFKRGSPLVIGGKQTYVRTFGPFRRLAIKTTKEKERQLTTRAAAFWIAGIKSVREQQNSGENIILSVLGEGGNAADSFRNVAGGIMAKMIKSRSVCIGTPRLRGDTIGYLAELVQHYAVERLQNAFAVAMHSERISVTKGDIMVNDNMRVSSIFDRTPTSTGRCSVGMKRHNAISASSCSCFCSSSNGTQRCWPEDDCLTKDIMPAEIRRKIVRRLAYRAGIVQLTSDAFDLIAAEMLHLLGVLLVDSFEASMNVDYGMYICQVYIKYVHRLTYGTPGDGLDMFSVPPPPLPIEDGYSYTIVPGQIKLAARKRFGGLTMTGTVVGDVWVPSSGFTAEEEREEEIRYYGETVEVALPYSRDEDISGNNGDEDMDVDYVYESDGYDTEHEYDDEDEIFHSYD